jgi:hypothetical protein
MFAHSVNSAQLSRPDSAMTIDNTKSYWEMKLGISTAVYYRHKQLLNPRSESGQGWLSCRAAPNSQTPITARSTSSNNLASSRWRPPHHLPLDILLLIAYEMTSSDGTPCFRDLNSILQANRVLHDHLNPFLWRSAASFQESTKRVLTHVLHTHNVGRLQ